MENEKSIDQKVLHIEYRDNIKEISPVTDRKYTMTNCKLYKDLYLTVGEDYDYEAKDNENVIYGEWKQLNSGYSLHLYCDIGDKWPEEFAEIRYKVFVGEIPCILQAIKCGEKKLFEKYKNLSFSPIYVSFNSKHPRFNQKEYWNRPCDYEITEFNIIKE